MYLNHIHPIGNSLKKQKSMYIHVVLTPSIKASTHRLLGILRTHNYGRYRVYRVINPRIICERLGLPQSSPW